MAKEYIEREALKPLEEMEYIYFMSPAAVPYYEADKVWEVLDNIPAADVVERKRGRWKFHKDGSGTCDQCHFTQKHIWDDDGWQNYCGVCGADMRERRENNE